ncbi:MAG: prephenate dehydratase [Acidobacteriota bacterium]
MAKRTSASPDRIAFQGELGAFSQMAIRQLLGPKAEAIPCATFEAMFDALAAGRVHGAMVPIENTLHGSVHENYDHLLRFNLPIVGETSVRIVHNLIVPPDVKASAVRRVYSHPVALNQCLNFFREHPELEKVTYYDTAGSVKMLAEEKPSDAAAIASVLAAEMYGCRIVKRSIEDDKLNFTRFFLLRKEAAPMPAQVPKRGYKTSLVFTTRNIPGALFRALSALALRDIDMNKIESRPFKGRRWEYLFYVDFLGHTNEPAVLNALSHLREVADMLKVLGCYPRGD